MMQAITIAVEAPNDATLTGYDQAHASHVSSPSRCRNDGADWREVARLVLGCDPDTDPECARRTYDSHLARARWMTTNGYRHLLRGGAPH
jgi:hypothetical protein